MVSEVPLGRARILPSRTPWEDEAPAEPDALGRTRLLPSRTPWEGEAPAEPRVKTNGCYCVFLGWFYFTTERHGIHGKKKG